MHFGLLWVVVERGGGKWSPTTIDPQVFGFMKSTTQPVGINLQALGMLGVLPSQVGGDISFAVDVISSVFVSLARPCRDNIRNHDHLTGFLVMSCNLSKIHHQCAKFNHEPFPFVNRRRWGSMIVKFPIIRFTLGLKFGHRPSAGRICSWISVLGWSFVLEAGMGCTFWLVSIWNNVVWQSAQ